jgi:hypothetical protein
VRWEGDKSASPEDRHDARSRATASSRGPAGGLTGLSRPRCEFFDIVSGRECGSPGEDRYEGALLCRPHAMLLGLEHRVVTLMSSLSVLDNWLDDNTGRVKDEVRVQRIRHWRREVLEQLEAIRE